MTTIVSENVAASLRSFLVLWLVEIRAGVYVGNLSRSKREEVWDSVVDEVGDGSCVMIWETNNESRYDSVTVGDNRRFAVDFDGLKLVGLKPI